MIHFTGDVKDSLDDDLRPEYTIDYSKARPNRFAARFAAAGKTERVALLDPDVAAVFLSDKQINKILRALIPKTDLSPDGSREITVSTEPVAAAS